MRKTILLTTLLLAVSIQAQNNFFYPKPEAGRIVVHKDLELRPGLKYDVYRPAGNDVVPLFVIGNVGSLLYTGWPIYSGWGEAIANAGMAGVVYQATQPTAIADFDLLMEKLRADSARLKLDPSRVFVYSASANVQFGLPLLMDAKRDYITGGTIYYGDANVETIRTDLPVLVVRAGLDNPALNERIDKLIGRALAANAPWTVENYGGGLHGFEAQNDTDITRALIHKTLSFAKMSMRPEMSRAYVAASEDAAAGGAFARGDWPIAIDGYRRRVAANPSDGESHLRLGIALAGTGQFAEGLPMIERAWELGRRGPRDVAIPAAQAAAGQRNVARAIHWLDIVFSTPFGPPASELRTAPEFAPIRNEPSFVKLLDEVEQHQRVAAILDSDTPGSGIDAIRGAKEGRLAREPFLINVAYRLLARGRRSEAIEVFRIATGRYPQSANAWESLSEALEAAGSSKEALDASRKALRLLPADQTLTGAARENVRRAATERAERLAGKG